MPGWGQLVTNRPLAGRVLVFISGITAIAALTAFLFVERVELAAWMIDPDVLLWVVGLNVVFLVIRLASTEMAWRDGGGRRVLAGALIALIVALPHVAVGWVGMETRSALVGVFGGPSAQAAEPPITTTTTSDRTTTTTSTTLPIELGPIVSAPGQYDDDHLTVQTTSGWDPFGTERLNILLLGGDAGPGRGGLRTDTMIVASIDPVTGDAVLVGVPRNFGSVTLTDGTPIPVTQLGHVYGWGAGRPDLFGDTYPGAYATQNAIENITGLEVDYFALVDLTGFADVVDAFGGVSLDVIEPVDGPLYDTETGGYEMVHIGTGRQHLDGAHALAFARARYGSSDYVRMGRQRCILAAMAGQADLVTLFARIGKLLDAVSTNLVTDIPADVIPDLIRLVPRVTTATTRTIGFDSAWRVGFTSLGMTIPDVDRIRAAVRETIEHPAAATEFGAAMVDAGC